MKRDEVHVGRYYTAKVSGKMTIVRIDEDRGMFEDLWHLKRRTRHLGWNATNVETGRKVFVRSAARLRKEVLKKPPLCA